MNALTENTNLDIEELFNIVPDDAKQSQKEIAKIINDDDGKSNLKASITIKKETQKVVKTEFVLAFTDNLVELSKLNISKNELKVICYILQIMEYGNLINLNQTAVAKAIGIDKGNISKIFKRLTEKQIFIKIDGHLFMNSNLFAKGLSSKLDEEKRNNLKNAKSNIINDDNEEVKLSPSI